MCWISNSRSAAGQEAYTMAILLDKCSICPPVSIYGDFDLIHCGNLLYYYRLDIKKSILDKFYRALSPAGYFVTGEAERDMVTRSKNFREVVPPAAVFEKAKLRGEPSKS